MGDVDGVTEEDEDDSCFDNDIGSVKGEIEQTEDGGVAIIEEA